MICQFEKVLAIGLPDRTDRRDGLMLAFDASDVHFDFVDGVRGEDLANKSLPPGHDTPGLKFSDIGSWRAHVNALARIVHRNYSSALIVEDDVDWDVRLKSLMRDLAISAHAIDQTAPTEGGTQIAFADLPTTAPPVLSPYGNNWDVLWLGHCGANLAEVTDLVFHLDDASVPQQRHLSGFGGMAPLDAFPAHARVVARRLQDPVCSTAYAVSRRGARALLQALGVQAMDAPFDVMLRSWCDGAGIYQASTLPHVCMGVVPALFKHWRSRGPVAGDSDIDGTGQGFREKAMSPEIRWSMRGNLERIWRGDSAFEDQYPDEATAT